MVVIETTSPEVSESHRAQKTNLRQPSFKTAIMKNALHDAAREHPSTRRAGRPKARAATLPPAQLRRALSDLAGATQALAICREQARSASEHIQILTEVNSRLNRELIELARREAQVRDFAYQDELTGLPNPRLLLDRLKQAVARAARQHKQVVLLLLDLLPSIVPRPGAETSTSKRCPGRHGRHPIRSTRQHFSRSAT
jgi:Diguanylate cyclase, GGDEF domain